MITRREEESGELQQIRIVIPMAFRQTKEADLVDQLRQSCRNRISLVAVSEGQRVGYILFTPVTIQGKRGSFQAWGLDRSQSFLNINVRA